MAHSIGAQGQVTSAKNAHKPAPIMTSPTKNPNPKFSKFFETKLQDFPNL